MLPLAEQVDAIRTRAAWCAPPQGIVKLVGPGAFDAAEALSPRDLHVLSGQILHSLVLSEGGKLRADLYIIPDGDDVTLLADGVGGEELVTALRPLIEELEVELEVRDSTHMMTSITGPYAWEPLAKVLGAEKVIITAKYDTQKELAPRFGADVVIPSNDENLVEHLLDETGGLGADLVVETVGGHAPTLNQALEVVRPAATVLVLGLWDDFVPVDSWLGILKDATLMFCMNHGVFGHTADYQISLDWMASGKIPAQDLVTHVLPLDQLKEGFELSADKTKGAIKVIIRP